MVTVAVLMLLMRCAMVSAQTVEPVIVEYVTKAEGRFQLTNNTLTPMAIVLEPKSFSIALDGKALFRPLDATTHVELSTMSFRLEPQQSSYVFYKAHADILPAWFTVYATFSPIKKSEGLKVRVMLPHTVYLYQKKSIEKRDIGVQEAAYLTHEDTVVCNLENLSTALVRVQEVRAVGGKSSVLADGFPMLPGSSRHLEIPWKQKTPPTYLLLHFPHFDVKEPLSVKTQ